jgi:pSer/pThr/pTyr-binding forkhead associated (FHA) protein
MSDWPAGISPIARYASTPQELQERLMAERACQAHLIYRDANGRQVIRVLASIGQTVTIGRREYDDISLAWDAEVSRLHAELRLVGRDWTIVDDGLSRNGSFVNRERVQGRRRLLDGDTIVLGRTAIVFRSPGRTAGATTRAGRGTAIRESVSEADRRLLVALCRPLKDPAQALPATNQAIADELYLSLPAVKKRLSALFLRFELDHLRQSEKRARLAIVALESGIVIAREL